MKLHHHHAEPRARRALRPKTVLLNRLPPQLRRLVMVLGDKAAFSLVEHLGGTPLWVPPTMLLEHENQKKLIELVGPQAFGALIERWGGQTLILPKYDSVARQVRHERVVHLRQEGATINQVALATGYTTRHVINILQRSGVVPFSQGDLFGDL